MKKFALIFMLISFAFMQLNVAQEETKIDVPKDKTALLIVDVQMFYFPGGQIPLVQPEETSMQIKKVLEKFRENNMKVIHIKHQVSRNGAIHPNVSPIQGEKVIVKTEANSFNGTKLHEYLQSEKITHLVVTGMQTHMCVEATTRAAYDKGFQCIVPIETATTRDLTFKDFTINAKDVHYSTLSTLDGGYAKVINIDKILKAL